MLFGSTAGGTFLDPPTSDGEEKMVTFWEMNMGTVVLIIMDKGLCSGWVFFQALDECTILPMTVLTPCPFPLSIVTVSISILVLVTGQFPAPPRSLCPSHL